MTEKEIYVIWNALKELYDEYGSEQLQNAGIAWAAEELMASGDRVAGTWIFANRPAWNDFLRTGILEMRQTDNDTPKDIT